MKPLKHVVLLLLLALSVVVWFPSHSREPHVARILGNLFEGTKSDSMQNTGQPPYQLPQNIRRVDTFELGAGKLAAIRVPWWADPCVAHLVGSNFLTRSEILHWEKFIRSGSTVIDIGAHTGDTTIPFAVTAARTIAFEPNPHVYSVLKVAADLNPQLNIHAYPYAVTSEHNTSLDFVYDTYQGGAPCNGGFQFGSADLLPRAKSSSYGSSSVDFST